MGSEINRHLASIQRVVDIRPIEGADNIEVATVLGWDIVVKKGEFDVGNLAVFFEIDSFLPRHPVFEFLEKGCLRKMGNQEGLRLRTIKLRGQLSQGLLLPVHILDDFGVNSGSIFENKDVTEIIGVLKWDPPLPASLGGIARGNFPTFLRKTDQERIQNCYGTVMKKYVSHLWEVTTKLDGSSFTAYYNDGVFGVCSRNLDLAESEENAFWQVARKLNLRDKLSALGANIAIQCELMGPGVQGNREGLADLDIFVFDIYHIDFGGYLDAVTRRNLTQHLGLKHVPVLHSMYNLDKMSKDDILTMAEGPSLNHSIREGIVFKSLNDPNVSFKAISNMFLLKEKD